jgi:hypothetical protein
MGRPQQLLFVSFYPFNHCTFQLSINSAKHHRSQLAENSRHQLPNGIIRDTQNEVHMQTMGDFLLYLRTFHGAFR